MCVMMVLGCLRRTVHNWGKSMIRRSMIAVAVTLAAATSAFAETPEERQACMDDAFRVCDRAIPDQNRVFACLVENHRIISPLCRQALLPYIPPEPTQPAPKQVKGKAPPKAKGNSKGPLDLNP